MAIIKKGTYRWNKSLTIPEADGLEYFPIFEVEEFVLTTSIISNGQSIPYRCKEVGIALHYDGSPPDFHFYGQGYTDLFSGTLEWATFNIDPYSYENDTWTTYQEFEILADITTSTEAFKWFEANAEPVVESLPTVEIYYKSEKIELSAGEIATLHIKDHKLTEDLVIKANAVGGGSSADCDGCIIEVDTLPIEGDETALYKMGGSYYRYAKELKDVIALQDGTPSSLVGVYEAQFNAKFELYYADNVENIPEADRKMPNEITPLLPLYYDAYTNDVVVWVGVWTSLAETLLEGMASGGTITDAGAEIEEGRYYALIGGGWKKYSSKNLIVEVDDLPTAGIEKTNLYKIDNTYFKYVNTMVDLVVATNYGQTSLVAYYEGKGYTVYLHYTENYNNLAPEDIIPTVEGATAGCYYDASRNDTFVYTNDLWVSLATILAEEGLAFANGGAIPDASYARAGGYFAVINSTWQPIGAEMYTGEVVIE